MGMMAMMTMMTIMRMMRYEDDWHDQNDDGDASSLHLDPHYAHCHYPDDLFPNIWMMNLVNMGMMILNNVLCIVSSQTLPSLVLDKLARLTVIWIRE